jgi:hypothetical protein
MPCPEVKPGSHHHWLPPHYCPNGDACPHTHTLLETMHHPLLYKSTLCVNYMENQQCDWAAYCSHAHGSDDLNDGTWFVKEGANPKSYQYVKRVIKKSKQSERTQKQSPAVPQADNPWVKKERRQPSKPPRTFASISGFERPEIADSFSSMTMDTSGDSRDKDFSSRGSSHRESRSSSQHRPYLESRNSSRMSHTSIGDSFFPNLSNHRISQDSTGFQNLGFDQNQDKIYDDNQSGKNDEEYEKSYFSQQPFLFGEGPTQSSYQPFLQGHIDSNSPNRFRYSPIAGKQQQQIKKNSPGTSSLNDLLNNPLGGPLHLPNMGSGRASLKSEKRKSSASMNTEDSSRTGAPTEPMESVSSFFSSEANANNSEDSPSILDQPFQTPFSLQNYGFLTSGKTQSQRWSPSAAIMNMQKDDFYLCQGCQVDKRKYCLIPCGHIVCQNCSNANTTCPICQKKTQHKQQVQW